jgi:hypothetical protein
VRIHISRFDSYIYYEFSKLKQHGNELTGKGVDQCNSENVPVLLRLLLALDP